MTKNILYNILLLFLFVIWPFGGFMMSFFLLYRDNITKGRQSICLFVLSLFWGLLAFTQKSLALIGTDCIRYYYEFENFEKLSLLEIFNILKFGAHLNFVFHPISAFAVALTKNVQTVSFLWSSLVYLLTYLSVRRLMIYYDCYTNRNFANIVLCLSFCFIAFVQVSELLKQASAFAVFFYGFTLFFTSGSKILTALLTFIAIGIHPTTMMLLPLFLYNQVRTKTLVFFIIGIIIVSQFVNIIDLFMNMLPGGTYTKMIEERFGEESERGGSLHYILLQVLMLFPIIYLWRTRKIKDKIQQNALNIVLLYFLISSLNFYNLVAYLRFSIFAHWIYALVMILCIKNICYADVKRVLKVFIICMFFMTMKWTFNRTLVKDGYCSSYMDNNIVNIVFSSSYNYLIVDYEK